MISTRNNKTLIQTICHLQKLALLGLALSTAAYATAADTQPGHKAANNAGVQTAQLFANATATAAAAGPEQSAPVQTGPGQSNVQWPYVNTGLPKRDPQLEQVLDQILARMTVRAKSSADDPAGNWLFVGSTNAQVWFRLLPQWRQHRPLWSENERRPSGLVKIRR